MSNIRKLILRASNKSKHLTRRVASVAVRKRPLTHEEFLCEVTEDGTREIRTPRLFAQRRFFCVENDRQLIEKVSSSFSSELKELFESADKTMKDTFRILGFPDYSFDQRIEWNKDFVSGLTWDNDYYVGVPIVRWNDTSDIKVPWELSRGHYLVWLSSAWVLTGRREFATKVISLMEDWLQANPYPYGPNWVCPMEAAIRMTNWAAALENLRNCSLLSDNFLWRAYRSIYQHAIFIEENIEFVSKGMNTNHYVADLIGLLVAGRIFDSRNARTWRAIAISELEEEIRDQTCPDGFCYESSLNYHLLTTEMFLLAYHLERETGRFSEDYIKQLHSMLALIRDILKPDGSLPNFGDGDSGRILVPNGNAVQDAENLLNTGAILTDRPDLATVTSPTLDSVWFMGERAFHRIEAAAEPRRGSQSKAFGTSGLAVMKDGENYLFLGANEVGTGGLGNHKHNDMLSIELSVGETNFIVDSGTLTYTSDATERNRFRSTSAHTVPAIKNREQNRFLPKLLFAIRQDAEVRISQWMSEESYDLIEAEHSGYVRLSEPVLIKRIVYYDKLGRLWLIRDGFLGRGEHDFENNIILGNVNWSIESGGRAILRSGAGDSVLVIENLSDGWRLDTEPHRISSTYGYQTRSCRLRYHTVRSAPCEMLWAAVPMKSTDSNAINDRMEDVAAAVERMNARRDSVVINRLRNRIGVGV